MNFSRPASLLNPKSRALAVQSRAALFILEPGLKKLLKPLILWIWKNEIEHWTYILESNSPWVLSDDRSDAQIGLHHAIKKLAAWEAA